MRMKSIDIKKAKKAMRLDFEFEMNIENTSISDIGTMTAAAFTVIIP